MSLQEEQAAAREFVLALMKTLESHVSPKELEIVVDQVLPVMVPAIVHLLKAVEASEEEDEDGVVQPPIQPLDHLARFLFRRNPQHVEPTAEMQETQAMVRRLMRK